MPGTSEADLARSLFREERYAEAAEHVERALALDPGNPDLTDLLAKASANATAEVDVFVPELRFFDADELLAPPPQPTLPSPRNLPGDPHWRRLRYWVGHTLGNLGGTVFESLMHVVGRRYRGPGPIGTSCHGCTAGTRPNRGRPGRLHSPVSTVRHCSCPTHGDGNCRFRPRAPSTQCPRN